MHITGPETRRCPPEFQERLTRLGGRNRFGEPNFKIEWNQSIFLRQGNVWRDRHGNERTGYVDRYLGDGQPCWTILKWMPPEHFGSPDTYYEGTFDSLSRLYICGEYPWQGRYVILQPLIKKEFVNNRLVIEHFEICHYLIDVVIPMILAFQDLSIEEQKAARDHAKAVEDAKETERIADQMAENMPTFINPVSYSRQGCRTSVLEKKMTAIQKVWDRLARGGSRPRFTRGITVGDAPAVRN